MNEGGQCDVRTVQQFRADGGRPVERQAFDQGGGKCKGDIIGQVAFVANLFGITSVA